MYCPYCGSEIKENDNFCPFCGKKLILNVVSDSLSGFSKAGFILSFFSFFEPLGLIFSIIGLVKSRRNKNSMNFKFALAGIIISGSLMIIAYLLTFIFNFYSYGFYYN